MGALEQEILEKFHQLDRAAQQRVRARLNQEEAGEDAFDYGAWLRNIENIREEIRSDHASKQQDLDVVDLLRAMRDGEDE